MWEALLGLRPHRLATVEAFGHDAVSNRLAREAATGEMRGAWGQAGQLWNHDDERSATDYFQAWYKRVIHTKLKPLKKVAQTIKE
jgi:hypothetical protein